MSSWITYDSAANLQEWQRPTEDAVAVCLPRCRWGGCGTATTLARWFVWDGAPWRRDRTGVATRAAREIARELGREPGGRVAATSGKAQRIRLRPRLAAGMTQLTQLTQKSKPHHFARLPET